MAKIELEAEKRTETGKKLNILRKQGLVPAIVYGKKFKALPVVVNKKSFEKNILKSGAGRNAIIALMIKGEKEVPALTTEIQRDPLTDEILHIDFNFVVMDEAVHAKIPIELVGVPVGVKEEGGILIHGLREVEVECLPGNIPEKFSADVTALKIGDSLHVSDLAKDNKIKILSSLSEMIASCAPPAKEEVAAPLPTPAEVPSAEGAPEAAAAEGKEKPTAPAATPAVAKPAAKPEK